MPDWWSLFIIPIGIGAILVTVALLGEELPDRTNSDKS